MLTTEIHKLKFGVYRVWWKSGGSSVASLGYFSDGRRWLAPSNWITLLDDYEDVWKDIRKMTFLAGQY